MYEHLPGVWNEIVSLINRKKFEEARERVKREFEKLCREEVAARRMMIDELNRSIFHVTCMIAKLEQQQSRRLADCPADLGESVRIFLKELKKQRASLEVEKRKVARGRS